MSNPLDSPHPPMVEAAVAYHRLGWVPVLVRHRGKNPFGNGWQRKRPTEEHIVEYWGHCFNVGVLLGAASGNLVDVDLDCPEALALAPRILPPTGFVFGRKSKPRSHMLYTSAAKTKRFHLPDGGTSVELRGEATDGSPGIQTVFPPSEHPSGETIEWDPDAWDGAELPPVVDAALLLDRVTRLAAACILLRRGAALENAVEKVNGAKPRANPPRPKASKAGPFNFVGHGCVALRARSYLEKMPPGISGSGGHDATFKAALALCRGFALPEDVTLELMHEFNQRCSPPWSDGELQHKVKDAMRSTLPLGYLLSGQKKGTR